MPSVTGKKVKSPGVINGITAGKRFQLAVQLQNIPGYRDLDAAFQLLSKHAAGSSEVRDRVSILLESEDRFVAKCAEGFLAAPGGG